MQISVLSLIIAPFVACGVGFLVGYVIHKRLAEARLESAEKVADKVIGDAKKKAEMMEKEAQLQAKDILYQTKADFDKEMADKRAALQRLERRYSQKEENIDKKVDLLDAKEGEINKKEVSLAEKEKSPISPPRRPRSCWWRGWRTRRDTRLPKGSRGSRRS